jgi:transcriptional regulator with GAF, ATPase, and Fis domain
MTREERLSRTFVELADTLVSGFDVVDFLHMLTLRCAELSEVEAVGLMLTDQRGRLRIVAASSEQVHLVELFQIQNEEGPCLDCYHTGEPVGSDDLSDEPRWPSFAREAVAGGFRTVEALPMRLRDAVIGALNLFGARPGGLSPQSVLVAQALADVATIGLLSERTLRERELMAEQLQTALNTRVLIEQAKGVLAERSGLDMAEAFETMRGFARDHNMRIATVAEAVIERAPTVERLTAPASAGGPLPDPPEQA